MYDSFGMVASRKDEITQIVLGERGIGGGETTAPVGSCLGQQYKREKDGGGL